MRTNIQRKNKFQQIYLYNQLRAQNLIFEKSPHTYFILKNGLLVSYKSHLFGYFENNAKIICNIVEFRLFLCLKVKFS